MLRALSSFGSIQATLCTRPTYSWDGDGVFSTCKPMHLNLGAPPSFLDGVIHCSMRLQQMQQVESTCLEENACLCGLDNR